MPKNYTWVLALMAAMVSSIGTLSAADSDPVGDNHLASIIGNKIEQFTLRDCYGTPRSLSDFQEQKILVVAFLGTECPLVKLYAGRLKKLADDYRDRSVAVVAVNSNSQDTMTELVAFAQRYKLNFPLLKDPAHKVADLFGAVRTPEVFVLDASRTVRYRGRIDDQYGIGYIRPEPERQDLLLAIDELLADQPVTLMQTEAVGCFIGRTVNVVSQGEITYTRHIAKILHRHCVECHRAGQIAPFTLTRYEDMLGWGETIREVVEENRMPPWNANPDYGTFSNDCRLTTDEKQLLYRWIADGMPEGDPDELPSLPTFSNGWRIPQPDQLVYMRGSQEPFPVPAQGVVDYQYFRVDPGWTEDKFIYAAEAKPGNTSVVHHIIAYVWPPGAKRFQLDAMLVGYAPGAPPTWYTEGKAMFVPAGSQLVFEMHYTPNGTAQQDLSYIGVKFMDKKDVKHLVQGRMAINDRFEIPPHQSNHIVTASHKIARDSLLLTMTPHMHLRGKAFTYEARYPDGQQEVLLDVPQYDFNWQLTYRLAQPKRLPRNTTITCTATFDNSSDNLSNPDPSNTVTWGEQSWDEMMIGFFGVIAAPPSHLQPARVDPTGTWQWTQSQESKPVRHQLHLEFTAPHQVTGTYESPAGRRDIQNGLISGDQLSLDVPLVLNGRQMNAAFQGHVDGGQLQGRVTLESGFGGQDIPLQAVRTE